MVLKLLILGGFLLWLRTLERGSRVAGTQASRPVACGIFPGPGIEPVSLHWQGFLSTGPPGIVLKLPFAKWDRPFL